MAIMTAPRRQGFEDITAGWGSDDLDDLTARVELLLGWWKANFPLQPAEHKVARAMTKRLGELGGIDVPVFN